ncbi:uncharacterized protein E0L32_008697 [Thyridium curvatum]|uniref:Aminotransferase class V domain-containing protein n=1 Tax=Thyridium curvatum TaxID=1093900 RepID=A0A507AKV1_9PEZI|nr:uncharacterized protein E0L32_008697 [Thyridium curvatum]TPX10292.1 hypothetical protein E0L32_008697 [Thyridium curvatum]
MGDLTSNEAVFGKGMLEHFLIDPEYRNLNQGSFGTFPKVIREKQRAYQDATEARPDPAIRYDNIKLLDRSRAAVAELLRVPADTVVFVSNATVGVNTVLRNLAWAEDGKDEIVYFSTIYGGCGKTIDYVVDTRRGLVSSRMVEVAYPCEDDEIVSRFRDAVAASRKEGKRPRVCLFDVVSSMPGVRFPFEAVTRACREEGVLSLVDGAQGIGLVDLDLGALDPDFFVSNCHKWLHVPRGCAVFYVPLRNQALVPSSVPTSHGYVPKAGQRFSPLPPTSKSVFVNNFEFVGTIDNSPYFCVGDSIAWRRDFLGGEEKILDYTWGLAKEGGRRVAEILGTEVMDNSTGTLTNCAMVNVALPLYIGEGPAGAAVVEAERAFGATQWMLNKCMSEYNTFIVLYAYRGRWWCRLSAQVFLDMDDFEFAGRTLLELCKRVGAGEDKA